MHTHLLTLIFVFLATAAGASCGGNFGQFLSALRQEAHDLGYGSSLVNTFFDAAQQDPKVLKADRSQGIFQKDFIMFSQMLISEYRLKNAENYADKYAGTFKRISDKFGVPPSILLAFWAFETDFGANQGNFNTLNSLITLAHNCRRPDVFRPQIFAALELFKREEFDPVLTKGAWAGEIGMLQFMPSDIIKSGTDGDGDGRVDLQNSAEDALMTGGHLLKQLGWQVDEPWLQEIEIPKSFDWSMTGLDKAYPVSLWKVLGVTARSETLFDNALQASVLLPVGHKGPAFLAYPNFRVYFEWNQSLAYVTTAAYFATILAGKPTFKVGAPDKGLNALQMQHIQTKLEHLGHNVGRIDGVLGAKTRAAVQAEQQRLGFPADAWPTPELLNRLSR